MRLHGRLVFLVGIAAGPALGLLVHSQSASHANRVAQLQHRVEDLALSATFHTEARIQSLRQVLIGFGAMLPQFEKDPWLCAEAATKLAAGFGIIDFGVISYGSENVRCGRIEPAAALANDPEGQAPGGPFPAIPGFGALRAGGPGETLSLAFVEPVSIDQTVAGAILANASVDWLIEGLGHVPIGQGAMVALVDRDGHVLARRPDAAAWLGRRIPDQVMQDIRNRRLDGRQEVSGLADRPVFAAAASISSLPGDLFVVAGLDRSAELAPIDRARLIDLAVLGLLVVAIFATALASWQTAGMVARREEGLSEAKAAAERLTADQQRIADTIGHDLRNSVQTLVSFLRNLRRNSQRPPDPAMFPHVARAVGDLRSSLDILIRASRLEPGALDAHRRPVRLSAFLRKIANDWQFYAETKGLTLTVLVDSETVETDPDLLRTIVSNLVSNAIKHTDSGGVTVSVEPDESGRTCISVRDTGRGIPPEKATVIFESFSRLEPEKTDGLGLGLSIAKRSADLLGCEIVLDQSVKAGSRFVVKCPDIRCAVSTKDSPPVQGGTD